MSSRQYIITFWLKRIMRKGLLICLMGIDGSGKTTQARYMEKKIKEIGIPCVYVWNRFEPKISKPIIALARLLFLRGKNIYKNYNEYQSIKNRLYSNSFKSYLYFILLLLDYSLQITFRVTFNIMFGMNIVCDRYIYDSAVDIAVDGQFDNKKLIKILLNMQRFVPKVDLVILIDLTEIIAYTRKQDVPDIEYLKERRIKYLYFVDKIRCPVEVLDGTKSIVELNGAIDEIIEKWLGVKCPER